MNCSKLNAHLKELHVVDSGACACGYDVEDTNHYLLNCPLYITERNKFMIKLQNLGVQNVNARSIVMGNVFSDCESNKLMYDA